MVRIKTGKYRPCVGIVVFNKKGEILICKWNTTGWDDYNKKYAWQAPQGGIDDGETALETAYREIYEETNICKNSLRLLKQTNQSYRYDFPEDDPQGPYDGQEQTWIAFQFLGDDNEIDVINCPDPCFVDWRWEKLGNLLPLIVPFKAKVYQQIIEEFREFSKA